MIQIRQEATYAGEGRWNWAVWIDRSSDHFDMIDTVAWYLHPSFPDPMRWVDTSHDGFRLEETSWGSFTVRATVYNEKGQPSGPWEHWLDLRYPDGSPATGKPTPRVFVSGSISDARIVRRLSHELRALGISVAGLDAELTPGQDWRETTSRAVQESDLVIAVIGKQPSGNVESDVALARSHQRPILPLVVADAHMPGDLVEFNAFRLTEGSDLMDAVQSALTLIGRAT